MYETTDELIKQISLGEDSSLELKTIDFRSDKVSDPHGDGMADELAAMANTSSGVIVLGVDDKTKNILGIPEAKLDIVETWLRDICYDRIKPPLVCRIRKVPVIGYDGEERVVIRIDIPKSLFVHQSPNGYFNRIGSSKRQMTPDILARLFQQRSQARIIRFDEQAVNTATVESLDDGLWRRFKTTLSPSNDLEFLQKIKMVGADDEGNICPTVGGILMASKRPEEHLSNAFIQAVSYRGTERNASYQTDAMDICGPLDQQVRDACKFVEKNMNIYAVKSPERREIPQYSMNAVFEAVVNAVAHRDYSIQSSKIRIHMFSDRMEIFSPGAIPNTMTIDSLPLRQASRNELVTSLLARCPINAEFFGVERSFIMDKRGEGVPIIFSESEKVSGKKPKYELIDETELQLTIYATDAPESDNNSGM